LVILLILALLGGLGVLFGSRVRRARGRARSNGLRATTYQKRAEAHRAAASDCEQYGGAELERIAREYHAQAALEERLASHHAQLARKYTKALSRPWLTFSPEAPPPK
jgi:hypothetical protein